MDVDLPADLHLQVRKIRNIEIWRSDLLPFIESRRKIPSGPINAYGARVQQLDGENATYTIFSSWIAALAEGTAKEKGPGMFSIEEHINAAVSLLSLHI